MQQKEIATLLDISPAMVSRLVKKGMPTDSLERAQKWRKRHLEPGRVKGARADTIKARQPTPPKPADPPPAAPGISLADVETLGELVNDALARGNPYAAAIRTHELRGVLRKIDADLDPVFSLRVWLALTVYMLHHESEVHHALNMTEVMTAGEFGNRVCPANPWSADTVLWEACDFDNNSINGWPDGDGEDEVS